MIKIIVDCFGGDRSPGANVEGGIIALSKFSDLYIIFTGDSELIEAELSKFTYDKDRVEVVHAPEVIGCDEKPTTAIRAKKESSMVKGINMLRTDDSIAGMVSTGSTGALVASAVLRVGRLKGVSRPAFCPILPTMNGSVVGICDSGANVDCTPELLRQFAIMGSLYMQKVHGVDNPRVAQLNVGVEAEKGDILHKEAYELLSQTDSINFVGNMESRDLLSGKFDLITCDGFSGNVLVKTTEGACLEMLKMLKKDIMSKAQYKFGALFLKSMFDKEKEFFNYQNYGGSVMLGTKKIIVKGHGSSNATCVAKCIEQAYRMENGKINEAIEKALAKDSEEV